MARLDKDFGLAAVRIEGGLLPPEFLQTITALAATKQAGTDYGLTRSLAIRDEIGRAWRMASDLWSDYRQRRVRADLDPIKVTVEEWLRPLLATLLGYPDITAIAPATIGERRFPIGHTACGGAVPLVLTGHRFDLDRADVRFGEESRRRPPHALLQEYLNADEACLWGLASNGNQIRLVRDNPSLTRPAFIEADLERIFDEQLFAAFAAFWLIFHGSRLAPEAGVPSACVLERWRRESLETGERAREKLRGGVTSALRHLGNGFLEHPANETLRSALRAGDLTSEAYFQELLRLVYRLLFLFTAEDRDLLFDPAAPEDARRLYCEGYAIARLRDRALKRRHDDEHGDLWEGLKITFAGLAEGAAPLGLPALGGIFAADQCPSLDQSVITNQRLLQAIRALTFFPSGKTLARVNYRDMGTEELGSVYESLLELRPRIDVAPWTFSFIGDSAARGSERKLTGSYYTPPALVNALITSALVPVIQQTLKDNPERPKEALLALNIVDPACGSGHFLLAAARRLAVEIARLNAGADTPGEALRQHALREVVQHCIHGVDRNPLAVELCKTALWIETVEPGRPLSFLDHHIQCGDSLIGVFDLGVLEGGIPDHAFKAKTGDNSAYASDLKRRNAEERKGQHTLGFAAGLATLAGPIAEKAKAIEDLPEEEIDGVLAKARRYRRCQLEDPDLGRLRQACDLWTAAFFASLQRPKPREPERVPTTDSVIRVLAGKPLAPSMAEAAKALASQNEFFHWPLQFPDVFAKGGFDVVLGNPPWEVSQLREEEYFAARAPEIAALKGAHRKKAILSLEQDNPYLWAAYQQDLRGIEARNAFIRSSHRYPLTAFGKLNFYALFAELALRLVNPRGLAGIIVQSGIASDDSNKVFFEEISTKGRLASLIDFENREKIFAAVDSRMKFCLLTLGQDVREAEFAFFATNITQLTDKRRRFTLSPADILRINPNTKTAPIFRSNADAELTKKIYACVPVLIDETKGTAGNPWGVKVIQNFFSTSSPQDQKLFTYYEQLQPDLNNLAPVRRGSIINQFDHCAATFDERTLRFIKAQRPLTEPLRADKYVPMGEVRARLRAKGWTRGWLMGWRDITNATNGRTVICSFLPIGPTDDTLSLLLPLNVEPKLAPGLLGALNSCVLDYVAQQKVGGTHVRRYVLAQLPIPSPAQFSDRELTFLLPRILELSYTAEDLSPIAQDLGYNGPPFPWDEDRRALLRAELDAYYARLYGLTRDELRYILDPADVFGEDYPSETFRVLKNKEIREYGEYRTRRLVLAAWDRLEAKMLDGVAA